MKIKTMFTILILSTLFNPVFASSIEDMERTRASLIKVILDPNLNLEKKESQITDLKLKLLDKERIVINDKKIIQNPNRYTIRAFEEFDLSFLVHASIEKSINIPSHWFNEIGITTSNLDNTSLITK